GVQGYTLYEEGGDGVVEPGSLLSVGDIHTGNAGGLSTPANCRLALSHYTHTGQGVPVHSGGPMPQYILPRMQVQQTLTVNPGNSSPSPSHSLSVPPAPWVPLSLSLPPYMQEVTSQRSHHDCGRDAFSQALSTSVHVSVLGREMMQSRHTVPYTSTWPIRLSSVQQSSVKVGIGLPFTVEYTVQNTSSKVVPRGGVCASGNAMHDTVEYRRPHIDIILPNSVTLEGVEITPPQDLDAALERQYTDNAGTVYIALTPDTTLPVDRQLVSPFVPVWQRAEDGAEADGAFYNLYSGNAASNHYGVLDNLVPVSHG
ncbi:hypothetical protein KIPB_014357, partial [Kipferlia bialata]